VNVPAAIHILTPLVVSVICWALVHWIIEPQHMEAAALIATLVAIAAMMEFSANLVILFLT
jgi:hypothetical protein